MEKTLIYFSVPELIVLSVALVLVPVIVVLICVNNKNKKDSTCAIYLFGGSENKTEKERLADKIFLYVVISFILGLSYSKLYPLINIKDKSEYAYQSGVEEGYNDGLIDGYSDGYYIGYSDGENGRPYNSDY